MTLAIVLAIFGIACATYGLKLVLNATNKRFHFIWFVLAAVLVAPVVLIAMGVWDGIPVALRWTVAGAFLLFVVYEIVAGRTIVRHFNDKPVAGLDYIAVLGARMRDGRPGRTFSNRLDVAIAYLADNPHTRCIVCGGQGPDEPAPEADVGRDYLVERGIDANRILLEACSRNTAQNIRFAAEIIDPEHDFVGIVTSDFHVARALALARKAGMEHVLGVAARSVERIPLNGIVRESFAWANDVLSGNV